jgi:hypothetical protein
VFIISLYIYFYLRHWCKYVGRLLAVSYVATCHNTDDRISCTKSAGSYNIKFICSCMVAHGESSDAIEFIGCYVAARG